MSDGGENTDQAFFLGAQVRAADAAIIRSGVPGYELMCRAAAVALRALRARWPVARDLLVLCGPGNNGGDGYVLARLARVAGLSPTVLAFGSFDALRGDAALAAADCRAAGVPILAYREEPTGFAFATADVIVDAMLGIGLTNEVRGDIAAGIGLVNSSGRPVVALDVPSGLCADSGRIMGAAVRADLTITFIAAKAGLLLAEGPERSGELVLEDLGADRAIVATAIGVPVLRRLGAASLRHRLRPRRREAHKGDAGHVFVIGGGAGMPGAAGLAGEAALRAGAGRVTVLCAPSSVTSIAARCAEIMVAAIDSAAALASFMAAADVLAVGPGLGRDAWAHEIFGRALAEARDRSLPTVIDADALNLLSAAGLPVPLPATCVLTPHPGEAARLLGCDTAAVQADRVAAIKQLHSRYAASIVLKGAGSLVLGGQKFLGDDGAAGIPAICMAGNPAMAAPGMGDVLTGVIAALLGQGHSPTQAAEIGVLWHALAGDAAREAIGGADRGMLASELAARLPPLIGHPASNSTRSAAASA